MIEQLSASGVKKFATCPKQFMYKYVDKPDIAEPEDPKFFKVGNSVHESIENVLEEHPDLRDQEMLLSLLRDENRSLEYDYGSDNEEQVQTCLETASKYISNHVDEVQTIEDRWTMDLEKFDISFVGYSDLTADNRIIDWKTGKPASQLEEKIQAGVYIELYKEELGKVPEGVEFVYLKEGELSQHNRVSEDDVFWSESRNKYFDTVMDYTKKIMRCEAKGEWPAEGSGDDCYWCDFKFVCADSPIGAENVEYHHIGGV